MEMNKVFTNKVMTNIARVSAAISLITGLLVKTVDDYDKIGSVSKAVAGGALGDAQRFLFALFPVLFLIFTLIKNIPVSRVLGIFTAIGQICIANGVKNGVLKYIWEVDKSGKGGWTFYFIMGIVSIIVSVAGIVVYNMTKNAPAAYNNYAAPVAPMTYANVATQQPAPTAPAAPVAQQPVNNYTVPAAQTANTYGAAQAPANNTYYAQMSTTGYAQPTYNNYYNASTPTYGNGVSYYNTTNYKY